MLFVQAMNKIAGSPVELDDLWDQSLKGATPLACMIIDADHFKKVVEKKSFRTTGVSSFGGAPVPQSAGGGSKKIKRV